MAGLLISTCIPEFDSCVWDTSWFTYALLIGSIGERMALHPDHCHGHYRKEYSQINSPTKLKICLSKQKLNSKLSKNRTIKKTSMIVEYLILLFILKSLIFESLLHGRCPTKHPQTRVQSNFRDCAVQPLLCHCFVHAKWPTLAWFVCIKLETSSRGITFFCELKLW